MNESIKLFKVVAKFGNLSLFSSGSAVQSRPKSHTFTVNLAVFAPQPRWRSKTVEGSVKLMFSLFDRPISTDCGTLNDLSIYLSTLG